MRVGCLGCLMVVAALLGIAVVAIGLIFFVGNVFSAPDVRATPFTRADGYAAQQKLYEILSRQAGRPGQRSPVVITEAEANAFLARHLDQSGLPLSPIAVRLAGGKFTIQGQTRLRNLFQSPMPARVASWVGDDRMNRLVWVTVSGRIRLEGTGSRRRGAVDVDEFAVGRQPLGGLVFTSLMGPNGGGILSWTVPSIVQDIRIGDGQLAVTTR